MTTDPTPSRPLPAFVRYGLPTIASGAALVAVAQLTYARVSAQPVAHRLRGLIAVADRSSVAAERTWHTLEDAAAHTLGWRAAAGTFPPSRPERPYPTTLGFVGSLQAVEGTPPGVVLVTLTSYGADSARVVARDTIAGVRCDVLLSPTRYESAGCSPRY